MSAYADSARLYLEAGWHPLPLLDNDKGEVPSGFTGYAARPVRPENVDRWARLHGDRPVCLRLMDEVGVDADNYEHGKVPAGAAATTLADGEERLGPLPLTVVVSSRFEDEDYDGVSGIRLFRLPLEYQRLAERKVWKAEVGPGVDVIRLGHRQVVVWPSKHPKRGSEYAYLDQRTGEIVHGPLPPSDTLPYLPEAWCEALLKPSKGLPRRLAAARRAARSSRETTARWIRGARHSGPTVDPALLWSSGWATGCRRWGPAATTGCGTTSSR